ncbi:MAG: RelA/SpoT family protein [Candidatus Gracilibacteria bacterium]|jgi:GTP pyrophosphokinase
MAPIDGLIKKIKDYDSDIDPKVIRFAYSFAEKAHKGALRKSGEPYIIHPIETAKILIDMKADQQMIVAALLHDTVEDTGVTVSDIKKNFGSEVALLVDGLTKISSVRYSLQSTRGQIDSLRKIFLRMSKDLRVILIKLADRLHNMRTLQFVSQEKRKRIAKETVEIYVPMARLLGAWDMMSELEDLCFKYLQPNDYEFISKKLSTVRAGNTRYINKLVAELNNAIQVEVDAEVKSEEKHLYHVYKAFNEKKGLFDVMTDCFSVKVVVPSVIDCYKALGVIHGLWQPRRADFRDYIAVPKANGYKGLHTMVFGPCGKTVEFHIKTLDMYEDAHFGIVAKWYRKRMKWQDEDLSYSWMTQVKDLRKMSGGINDKFLEDLKGDVFEDRIFVFTDKGRAIDLPEGATVVDFAYAVNPYFGHNFSKAFVNKRIRNPMTVLRTGDVVTIEAAKSASGPDLFWVDRVKTSKARNNIRKWLAMDNEDIRVARGMNFLDKSLKIFLCTNFKKEEKKISDYANKNYGHRGVKGLLADIGTGVIFVKELLRSIYKDDCLLGKSVNGGRRQVCLIVKSLDRRGLLNDISRLIAKGGLNIIGYSALVDMKTRLAEQKFTLEVYNFDQVYHLCVDLRYVDEISGVRVVEASGK